MNHGTPQPCCHEIARPRRKCRATATQEAITATLNPIQTFDLSIGERYPQATPSPTWQSATTTPWEIGKCLDLQLLEKQPLVE
jgi:hypothetical protein